MLFAQTLFYEVRMVASAPAVADVAVSKWRTLWHTEKKEDQIREEVQELSLKSAIFITALQLVI